MTSSPMAGRPAWAAAPKEVSRMKIEVATTKVVPDRSIVKGR
jgi:hypothetical protein